MVELLTWVAKVALKIISHCRESLPNLVTGQLLGLDVQDRLEVTNCFPFPTKTEDEELEHDGLLECKSLGLVLIINP